MKINGIGVISKKQAMSILTRDGRESVKNGEITTEELGAIYKLEQIKKVLRLLNWKKFEWHVKMFGKRLW